MAGSRGNGRGGYEYLAILRMGDANCVHHLIPIAQSPEVELLRVVRPGRRPPGLRAANIDYRETTSRFRGAEVIKTFLGAIRHALRNPVKGVVSFNAIPYGVIAVIVGAIARVPVHVGFVGTEAHRLQNRRRLRPLDRVLARAQLITTPGPVIREELITRGYDGSRIEVLPHSIDTESFRPPKPGANRDIDVLFVGALKEVKQVDLILRALPAVITSQPRLRAVLVGDGPLRPSLERLAIELGISAFVEFAGHQADASSWFRRAKVVLVVSKWEGFPFVLAEAMCSGAVPIATRVGSIPDVIESGGNGILLESDSPESIAVAVASVLDDASLQEELSSAALRSRSQFGYQTASSLWSQWLTDDAWTGVDRP